MKRQIRPKQLRSSDSSSLEVVFDLKYIPFIKLDSMSDQQLPKFVGERNLLMVLLDPEVIFDTLLSSPITQRHSQS